MYDAEETLHFWDYLCRNFVGEWYPPTAGNTITSTPARSLMQSKMT